MPVDQQSRREAAKPKKGTSFWILMSFMVSLGIVAWAFTIPLRQTNTPAASASDVESNLAKLELAKNIKTNFSSSDGVREAARQIDRELIRQFTIRRSQEHQELPGARETRVRWRQRINQVKQEVSQFRNVQEGSIEWRYRKEKLDTFRDGPNRPAQPPPRSQPENQAQSLPKSDSRT